MKNKKIKMIDSLGLEATPQWSNKQKQSEISKIHNTFTVFHACFLKIWLPGIAIAVLDNPISKKEELFKNGKLFRLWNSGFIKGLH